MGDFHEVMPAAKFWVGVGDTSQKKAMIFQEICEISSLFSAVFVCKSRARDFLVKTPR